MRPLAFAVCMLLPLIAQAQEEPQADAVYPEKSEVNFDDPLGITGKMVGPSEGYVQERRAARVFSFIDLRKDFRAEMSESVNEVR